MKFKNILCPLDFSENMDKIINIAINLASSHGTINLFHHSVLLSPTTMSDSAVGFEADSDLKEFDIKQLEDLADKLKLEHPALNFKTYHSYLKSLVDDVNDIVKNDHIDLIVMGSHGRTGLSRLFMGSIAEDVFRHATCPVFLVKL